MYKKALIILAIIIIMGILSAVGVIVYDNIQEKYRESEVKRELTDYYRVPEGEAIIIFDEKIYEKNALIRFDEPYMDLSTVKERYNRLFFWDEPENKLFFTTTSSAYVFEPDSVDFTLNGKKLSSTVPTFVVKDGEPYIAMSFLLGCSNITYRFIENPARILVTYGTEEYICVDVIQDAKIRVDQDIKSDYVKEVKAGDVLRIIEGGGIQENGFIKVMSDDGVRGYIKTECLDMEKRYSTAPVFNEYIPEEHKDIKSGKKLYLAWHLVYDKNRTEEMLNITEKHPEINVVSPTWFFMCNTKGGFNSHADEKYISAAHNKGIQVWAVLKNDTVPGQFQCSEDSHKVLSSYEARTSLIDNMVKECITYGIDGINIDLELLKVETGVYFIQFLRELSIKCSNNGIVLSVDNYVPEGYNAYYDIPSQAGIVDHVVIMGYDEHYSGSDAGSVSSLGWFKKAVEDTVQICPADKVIMAVPFYTRLFKEEKSGEELKTTVEGTFRLSETENFVSVKGLTPEWHEDEGQFYLEYEKDNAKYRLWIEDEKSLTLKVLAAREKEVAGIAAWRLGGEKEGIWLTVKNALEGIPETD